MGGARWHDACAPRRLRSARSRPPRMSSAPRPAPSSRLPLCQDGALGWRVAALSGRGSRSLRSLLSLLSQACAPRQTLRIIHEWFYPEGHHFIVQIENAHCLIGMRQHLECVFCLATLSHTFSRSSLFTFSSRELALEDLRGQTMSDRGRRQLCSPGVLQPDARLRW